MELQQAYPYQYWYSRQQALFNYSNHTTDNANISMTQPGGVVHIGPSEDMQIIPQKYSECEYCGTIHVLENMTVLRCVACGAPLSLAPAPQMIMRQEPVPQNHYGTINWRI